MGILSGILELLFPPKCAFCGKVLSGGGSGVCGRCRKELPWLKGPEAEQKGEFFALCVSPLRYEGAVRRSIHRYKFKGLNGYAGIYAEFVAQCVREHLEGRYELISWVPLSQKRRRERGYDQAFLLAQAAAAQLGEVAVQTLEKARDTDAQSGLRQAEARRANVLGAYRCVDGELVEGRRILLIDDVVTTGSTLSECARTLLDAGAREVVCATVTRAGG